MRRRWRLRFGESPLGEWTHRHAQLQDPKRIRFAAKAPAQSGDAVQIARSAHWRVLVLETLESFRVKMAAASMHITEKMSGEYACLTASSNMLLFLREELTNLPKMARTAFCLPSRPPAKGCPARLRACVGVVKPCTRGVFVGMCMNAPFWAGATLVIVHLDRREVGGESEGYARCRRCRVASCSFECKGIPACVWDCPKHA